MTEVALRDTIDDDLPILFEHQQDPEAARMAAFPSRDRERFMAHWAGILTDPNLTAKTVIADGEVAGNIGVFDGPKGEREVGYWIGREFWGRGIATRALSLILREVETRPLFAGVAKHNLSSLRVLEKCGFTIVGEESGDGVELFVLRLDAGRT
jgi:RimJ/RimL family protein N-acetyltransferase